MALDITCPQCGSPNPSTNRFCGSCGAILAAAQLPSGATANSADAAQAEPADAASPQRDPDAYLPDWLLEADASAQSGAAVPQPAVEPVIEQPIAPPAEPVRPELPAWLRAIDDTPTEPVRSSPVPERTPAQPPLTPELPAWLAADDPQPAQAGPPAQPSQTPPAQVPDIIPSWLAEVAEGDAAPTGSDRSFWEQQPGAVRFVETGELPPWLQDDSEEGPPAQGAPEPATTGSAELPAWLRDDRVAATESAQVASADAADALPSWLQEPQTSTPPPAASQAPPPASGSPTDLPSWLADLDQEPTTRVTSGAATGQNETGTQAMEVPAAGTSAPWPEPQSDALPNWLTSIDQEQPAPAQATELPSWLQPAPDEAAAPTASDLAPGSVPASDAPAESHLPDWLRNDTFTAAETTPPSSSGDWLTATGPEPASKAADDLMSWLQEPNNTTPAASDAPHAAPVARSYPVADTPSEAEQPPPASTGMPPWLAGMESTAAAPDSTLPPWLNDLAAPTGTPSDEDADLADATPEPAPASSLPPWLEEAEPSGPVADTSMASWLAEPEPAANAAAPRTEQGFLDTLELPAWLRDEQPAASPAAATANTPEWLRDLDTDTDVVEEEPEPVAVAVMPEIERSPQRLEAMQLLERILAEPAPEPEVQQEVPLPRRRIRVVPLILVVLILVAVILFVLLNPRMRLGFGTESAPPAAIRHIAEAIAALPADRPVMVAYEWDLRRAAELEPLEENLLASLVTRQTPLLLVTTDPQGALLARRRSALLRERQDGFYDQDGVGYVDLGFKAGGPLALARLATNFPSVLAQDWAGRDLERPRLIQNLCQSQGDDLSGCSLDRLGMLVVLADDHDDVQAWVEQVASTQPGLPVVFAVPAEAAPLVEPYLSRSNWSMIAGLDGALALQNSRGVYDDWIGRRADATAVGQATFGVLLVAGAIPALWNGWRARRSVGTGPWED